MSAKSFTSDVRAELRSTAQRVVLAMTPTAFRWIVLRAFGVSAERCRIAGRCFVGRGTVIKSGAFLNYDCFLDASAPITIGRRTFLAPGVRILTSSHTMGPPEQRAGALTTYPVEIGDGAWIGAMAVILPGVIVGDGAVVAAGAVVREECEPNALYAGVPARKIRDL